LAAAGGFAYASAMLFQTCPFSVGGSSGAQRRGASFDQVFMAAWSWLRGYWTHG